MTYRIKRRFRPPMLVEAASTLHLRKQCRALIGRRRSALCRYVQIGANSFRVVDRWGFTVVDAYRDAAA